MSPENDINEIVINVEASINRTNDSPIKYTYVYENDAYQLIPHILKIDGSLIELKEPILNYKHGDVFVTNRKFEYTVNDISYISFILEEDGKWSLYVTIKDVKVIVCDKVNLKKVNLSDYNKKINSIAKGDVENVCFY